jgi:hypothetical protein
MQSYPWRGLTGHMMANSWSASQPLSAEVAARGEPGAPREAVAEVCTLAVAMRCTHSKLLIDSRSMQLAHDPAKQ